MAGGKLGLLRSAPVFFLLRYKGRSFKRKIYCTINSKKQKRVESKRQLEIYEDNSENGEKCEVPDEPQKKARFLEKPRGSLLGDVLATVIGARNSNRLDSDPNACRAKKIRVQLVLKFVDLIITLFIMTK